MEIYKIIRKKYPRWVKRVKTVDIDLELCSPKFRNYLENHPHPEETFIKCDENGVIDFRPRKKGRKEYRIYDIMKHEEIVETKIIS